jgi:hypothetical protein
MGLSPGISSVATTFAKIEKKNQPFPQTYPAKATYAAKVTLVL